MKIVFELTKKQKDLLTNWTKTLPQAETGAINGRLEYIIIPTNIGDILKVRDSISKSEIDLTDYSEW